MGFDPPDREVHYYSSVRDRQSNPDAQSKACACFFGYFLLCFMAGGFGVNWGSQRDVKWYQAGLLQLGITHVYWNGTYRGTLNADCTLADDNNGTWVKETLMERSDCDDFHVAQQSAVATAVFDCFGVAWALVRCPRHWPTLVWGAATLISGMLALGFIPAQGGAVPGWFLVAWLCGLGIQALAAFAGGATQPKAPQ